MNRITEFQPDVRVYRRRDRDWRRNRLRGGAEWRVLIVADLTLFPHGGVVIQRGPRSSSTRNITLKNRTRWGTRRESLGRCWSSGKSRSGRLLGNRGRRRRRFFLTIIKRYRRSGSKRSRLRPGKWCSRFERSTFEFAAGEGSSSQELSRVCLGIWWHCG